MKPARRSIACWSAIFAMALQALWPLIAQARPAAPGILVHVCSADGRARSIAHFIELARDDSPLEKRSAAQQQHCPLCTLDGDRAAVLPPPDVPALVVPHAAAAAPELSDAVSPVPPSYPPAQSRAPPPLS